MKWTTTDDMWVYFFSFFLLKFYFYYMIWNGSLINIYPTSFIWLVRIVFVLFIIFSFWLHYTHVLYTNIYSNLWFICILYTFYSVFLFLNDKLGNKPWNISIFIYDHVYLNDITSCVMYTSRRIHFFF